MTHETQQTDINAGWLPSVHVTGGWRDPWTSELGRKYLGVGSVAVKQLVINQGKFTTFQWRNLMGAGEGCLFE